MYCRQCGVQLPTNAKFCPKCGTQTTTNGNNVSNGQDTIFWICLLASILLLFIFAIYHTNLIGMTYVDWLFADCSGFSELDDVFDDSNQSFEELCYERKGQGFLISRRYSRGSTKSRDKSSKESMQLSCKLRSKKREAITRITSMMAVIAGVATLRSSGTTCQRNECHRVIRSSTKLCLRGRISSLWTIEKICLLFLQICRTL